MNKIICSGIILLIAVLIFIVLVIEALHTPWLWLPVIGQIAVSYGIFDWHMGIIHDYQTSQKA